MSSAAVRVSNLSADSTEESDIKSVTVTDSDDGRTKEAEIVFESDAAASTAVLLNNALVDGRNIAVVLVGGAAAAGGSETHEPAGGNAYYSSNANASNTSFATNKSSVVSEIMSEAKSVASQVSTATRELNAKYDVTGKLKSAYSTAATTTATTFAHLDTQYHIRENTNKALEATKSGLSSMFKQVSGFWAKQTGAAAATGDDNGANLSPEQAGVNSASSNGSAPPSDAQ